MASNGELKQRKANGSVDHKSHEVLEGVLDEQIKNLSPEKSSSGSPQSATNLLICVGGIYASLYVEPRIRIHGQESRKSNM